jgi:hypothetical protein
LPLVETPPLDRAACLRRFVSARTTAG